MVPMIIRSFALEVEKVPVLGVVEVPSLSTPVSMQPPELGKPLGALLESPLTSIATMPGNWPNPETVTLKLDAPVTLLHRQIETNAALIELVGLVGLPMVPPT